MRCSHEAGGVGDERLEVGKLCPVAFRFVDQRPGVFGLSTCLVEITGVPGDYPAGNRKSGLLGARGSGELTQNV